MHHFPISTAFGRCGKRIAVKKSRRKQLIEHRPIFCFVHATIKHSQCTWITYSPSFFFCFAVAIKLEKEKWDTKNNKFETMSCLHTHPAARLPRKRTRRKISQSFRYIKKNTKKFFYFHFAIRSKSNFFFSREWEAKSEKWLSGALIGQTMKKLFFRVFRAPN